MPGSLHKNLQLWLVDRLEGLEVGYVAKEYKIGNCRMDVVLHAPKKEPTKPIDKYCFEVKTMMERGNWENIENQYRRYRDLRYKVIIVGKESLFLRTGIHDPTEFGKRFRELGAPVLAKGKFGDAGEWLYNDDKVPRIKSLL